MALVFRNSNGKYQIGTQANIDRYSTPAPSWTNTNLPQPIIYSPFSKDILNYASGIGVPFWSIYSGTGTVAITTTPTLLTSTGSITKTGTGTSYLAATLSYPNNAYTLPTNNNGYSISYWMNYSTTSTAPVPVSMLPVPNIYTTGGTELIGHHMNSVGLALFQPRLFNTNWNSGFPQTGNGTWVHYVATLTTAGVHTQWLCTAENNILTQGTTTTGTASYIANSGINDIRLFSSGGFNNASGTTSYSTSVSEEGNTSIADFYYFDAVLTNEQISYLHNNQVFS
jgi:hypothetical protein